MKHCKRCLLPQEVPGANLDSTGVCSFCKQYDTRDQDKEVRERKLREADLEEALKACRGKGEYDCLVNLSGGKDSCYLLYKLKREYGLNVLAFTTNINVPDVAWQNIRRTIHALGVHHISYTPPPDFYRKLFRILLQNQEERGAVRTVCYVCAPLFEGYSLRIALEKGISLIVAGYSPGQPDPDRMVYELSRRLLEEADWTPPEIRRSGLFSHEELKLFWNPLKYPPGTSFPRYLAPFHAWSYNQAEVMRQVVRLGLIENSSKASPVRSNCPINWLLMYSDLKHLGYNPYAPEFSKLIREGRADRWHWKLVTPVLNAMIRSRMFLGWQIRTSLRWLGLNLPDLRITRPQQSLTATDSMGIVPLAEIQSSVKLK